MSSARGNRSRRTAPVPGRGGTDPQPGGGPEGGVGLVLGQEGVLSVPITAIDRLDPRWSDPPAPGKPVPDPTTTRSLGPSLTASSRPPWPGPPAPRIEIPQSSPEESSMNGARTRNRSAPPASVTSTSLPGVTIGDRPAASRRSKVYTGAVAGAEGRVIVSLTPHGTDVVGDLADAGPFGTFAEFPCTSGGPCAPSSRNDIQPPRSSSSLTGDAPTSPGTSSRNAFAAFSAANPARDRHQPVVDRPPVPLVVAVVHRHLRDFGGPRPIPGSRTCSTSPPAARDPPPALRRPSPASAPTPDPSPRLALPGPTWRPWRPAHRHGSPHTGPEAPAERSLRR